MDATVRVLAEPDEINLLLLGFYQEDIGYLESIASSLAQRLIPVKNFDDLQLQGESGYFSALLIDVNALEMDAFLVTEKIRQHRRFRETPLLILANAASFTSPLRAGGQGDFIDVLLKPVPAQILHEKLALYLRLTRQAITMQKQAKRIEFLETELHLAGKMLAKRDVQLRQASEEMNQFAYIASHDLREPLRMVSSFMELLSDRYQVHLDEQARKFIFYAVDGAVRMQYLINGIVEFNHIRRNPSAIELISANMIVEAALINLSARLSESSAAVTRDELPAVYADRVQLTQVFECILDNAIKFRSERPLEIHISAKREAQSWVFSIRDNGIGFDETQAKRVFGLFQTLHERDKYHGHGIGLAIAKKIIESYGGEIWVAAVSDQGSRFDFRWPTEEFVDMV